MLYSLNFDLILAICRLCCDSIPSLSSRVDDWIYFLTHSAGTRTVCHMTYTMQHVVEYCLYKNTRVEAGATVCIYVLLVHVVGIYAEICFLFSLFRLALNWLELVCVLFY